MHIFREPESWNVSTGTSRSLGPEHAWYKWLKIGAGIPKLDFWRTRFRFLEWLNGSGLRVCQALIQHSLFLAGASRSVLVDYREGLAIWMVGHKLCSIEKMACSWLSWKYSAPFGWPATFSWPLMSLWTKPKTSAWRWLLVEGSSAWKITTFRALIFLHVSPRTTENSLCHP